MYERFTDRAKKVMELANQKAKDFNHTYIGTEHMLLALVENGTGEAVGALKSLVGDIDKINSEVDKLINRVPDMITMGQLPLAPDAKTAIAWASKCADFTGNKKFGTEYLLLGLMHDSGNTASQAIANAGVSLDKVSASLIELINLGKPPQRTATIIVTHASPYSGLNQEYPDAVEIDDEVGFIEITNQNLVGFVQMDGTSTTINLSHIVRIKVVPDDIDEQLENEWSV